MKIKYFLIPFLLLCLFNSCKDDIYEKYEIIDGDTWNIEKLKYNDKYLVGGQNDKFNSGNYLYIIFRHNKFLIKLYGKSNIQGDFKIKSDKLEDNFNIYNSTDSIFNGKYRITLDTIFENSLGTNYRLILKSKEVSISAKKILIKPLRGL